MTKASDAAVTCVETGERERTVELSTESKKWREFQPFWNGAESQAFDRVLFATHRPRGRNSGQIQRSVAIAIAVDRLWPYKWHDSWSSCDRRSDAIGDSLNFSWNPVILAKWLECEKTKVNSELPYLRTARLPILLWVKLKQERTHFVALCNFDWRPAKVS